MSWKAFKPLRRARGSLAEAPVADVLAAIRLSTDDLGHAPKLADVAALLEVDATTARHWVVECEGLGLVRRDYYDTGRAAARTLVVVEDAERHANVTALQAELERLRRLAAQWGGERAADGLTAAPEATTAAERASIAADEEPPLAELATVREALRFYRDGLRAGPAALETDGGDKAREALQALTRMEPRMRKRKEHTS